jgi:hypothetical protein
MHVNGIEIRFDNAPPDPSTHPEETTLYLDTGGQNEGVVFDHHFSDTDAQSTVQILNSPKGLARIQHYLNTSKGKNLILVTHPYPDLDAITACVIVLRLQEGKGLLAPGLIEIISRHDQGYATSNETVASIPIFFALLSGHSDDEKTLCDGLAFLDILQEACEHNSFQPGITDLTSIAELQKRFPKETKRLQNLEEEYQQVINQAKSFTAPHPTLEGNSIHGIWLSLSGSTPPGFKTWLKKKMEADPTAWGQILVIRWKDAPAPRVVISGSPDTGLNLQSWGQEIDRLESEQSERLEKSNRDLPHILQHIADQRGQQNNSQPTFIRGTQHPRPGFNNNDPWYDGRGHQGSIIDSPRSGTILSDQEIQHLLDFT